MSGCTVKVSLAHVIALRKRAWLLQFQLNAMYEAAVAGTQLLQLIESSVVVVPSFRTYTYLSTEHPGVIVPQLTEVTWFVHALSQNRVTPIVFMVPELATSC